MESYAAFPRDYQRKFGDNQEDKQPSFEIIYKRATTFEIMGKGQQVRVWSHAAAADGLIDPKLYIPTNYSRSQRYNRKSYNPRRLLRGARKISCIHGTEHVKLRLSPGNLDRL